MEDIITEEEIRLDGENVPKGEVISDVPNHLKRRWLRKGRVSKVKKKDMKREKTTDKSAENRETTTKGKEKYKIKHKGGGYYDLIDKWTGETVNDSSKRKDEIKELKEEMESK